MVFCNLKTIKKYKWLLVFAAAVLVGGLFFFYNLYHHDIKALESFIASYEKFDKAILDFSESKTDDSRGRAVSAFVELNANASVRISSLIKNDGELMNTEREIAGFAEKEFESLKNVKEHADLTSKRKAAYARFQEFAGEKASDQIGENQKEIFRSRLNRDEEKSMSTEPKGFGNLCSSRQDWFVFCKNNVVRCSNYCKRNPTHEFCKLLPSVKPQAWVPNVMTQPLPEGASTARLVLPAPLDAMPLTEFGSFGAHRWGHTEGLDHEWISIKNGIPVSSWADGEVVYARPNNNPQDKEYRIIIYYGDGLWGEHMGVAKPLAKEGQRVKAGEPVAYGEPLALPGHHFAAFNLVDQHRRDGVGYWYTFVKGATFVSPFDYLRDDVRKELEEKWKKDILARISNVTDYNSMTPTPWEPYLTNPLFFHKDHKGALVGEWFLRSKPWAKDAAPDIMILLPVQSPYYQKQRVIAVDDDTGGPNDLHGDWEADYTNRQITITTDRGTFYGIFALDESGPQARLTIEYQQESYPTKFSERALVYTERDSISKGAELHYWERPEDDPRRW